MSKDQDPRLHYVLGKPHPDRAVQFMPFESLKGFQELIQAVFKKHEQDAEHHPKRYTAHEFMSKIKPAHKDSRENTYKH